MALENIQHNSTISWWFQTITRNISDNGMARTPQGPMGTV